MPAPPADDAEALGRLHDAGLLIVTGIEALLAPYLIRACDRVLDAWGRLDAGRRRAVDDELRVAAAAATTRAVAELRALFALDPEAQVATPLEIVRGSYREPTATLQDAGVGAVVRDAFEERAWPDDHFGLVPRTFADLADEEDDELGPAHLAWGMAKAVVVRARGAPS